MNKFRWFIIALVIASLVWPVSLWATSTNTPAVQAAPLLLQALPAFAKITAGGNHTCALTSAGGVKCWGYNGLGQLGDATNAERTFPVDVNGLTSGVTALAAGYAHTCAVTSTGGVKCWGYNQYGQLGDGTTTDNTSPVDVSGLTSGVIALAAGNNHTCAVTGTGGVKCWGINWEGELGDGTNTSSTTPVDVSTLSSGVVALAAGGGQTCALTTAGGVKCWGANWNGQLGDGTITNRSTPVDVSGLTSGVTALAAGWTHTCAAISAGGVKCWGSNGYGQLGDGTKNQHITPIEVNGLTGGVAALAGGFAHTCAITSAGGVKCWGINSEGQLGDGSTINRLAPVDVKNLTSGVVAVATGEQHSCAITNTGGVKCWGNNPDGRLSDGNTFRNTIPVDVSGLASNVDALAAGYSHTCAVTSTGGMKCWGDNSAGQLGDGTRSQRSIPVDVNGLTSGVTAPAAGWNHSCALTSTGGAKCWGDNLFGQLGNGTTVSRTTPVEVSGLTSGITALAAGFYHTCALTSAGGVKCWGYNGSGQLGDGTYSNHTTPVNVSGLTSGVTALAVGNSHSCALTAAGGVKCWGSNNFGQLGDDTTTNRPTPVDVSGLTSGVKAITLGNAHTCAISSAGGAKCWGNNNDGQLGDGSTTNRSTPVDVIGLTSGVATPAAGWYHTCAVTSTHGVKCWGRNGLGQLGDGTTTQSLTPVEVTGLSDGVVAIATGEQHTCVLTNAGGLKCWGLDNNGQVGVGAAFKRLIPANLIGARIKLNHLYGNVGSYFTISGENFPPNGIVSVTINGQVLTDALQINETGGFIFFIDTTGANAGSYLVKVGDNPSANGLFILDAAAPLYLKEGGGQTLNVPPGIATASQEIFLPMLIIY